MYRLQSVLRRRRARETLRLRYFHAKKEKRKMKELEGILLSLIARRNDKEQQIHGHVNIQMYYMS